MKVVRIIARLNVGGPARHVTWLTAGLQQPGYESVLVVGSVPPGEDDMSYFARAHDIEPLVISELSREVSIRDLVAVWKLYRLLVRLGPDVVHTHTAKAGTVGRVAGLLYRWLTPTVLAGRPRRCCFVHTYHGHVFHSYYGPLKTRVFLTVEKLLARVATNRIVVVSPQQRREIHERFGVGQADQFAVVPLGLDLSIFADQSTRRNETRRALGANDADVLIGIVGRLTEIKNHKLFLQAVALYKESYARTGTGRVRFLVIGDGHLRGFLEREAHALRLDEEVTFLGTRDDPENFYPALDVVALSSLNEGTPLTLIEAMANGRAVVATAVGGVVDLLGDLISITGAAASPATNRCDAYTVRERGVLVQPNDADSFCRGLALVAHDEKLRSEMGERGRLFVERHHSRERLVANVANIYHELLASKGVTSMCRHESWVHHRE